MDYRDKPEDIVPDNVDGKQVDTGFSITAPSEEDAKRIFSEASQRLLNINQWSEYCGLVTSTFQLTDDRGTPVKRLAQLGDYFKIDIPGPGPSAGDGDDWVKIEAMDESKDEGANSEQVAIRVRPSPAPVNNDKDVAHFYHPDATSTFAVSRKGNIITASIHGRNEKPNSDTSKAADKVRNTLVALGGISGFSMAQWKQLANGLLDFNK